MGIGLKAHRFEVLALLPIRLLTDKHEVCDLLPSPFIKGKVTIRSLVNSLNVPNTLCSPSMAATILPGISAISLWVEVPGRAESCLVHSRRVWLGCHVSLWTNLLWQLCSTISRPGDLKKIS